MIKLIDPNAFKDVEISGTKVTIRPLQPSLQQKAMRLWQAKTRPIDESASKEEQDTQASKVFTEAITDINRDDLAELIAPGVVTFHDIDLGDRSMVDVLKWIEAGDFWTLAMKIIMHNGLDEEEVKNSDSSLAQGTPVSTGSAEKNAEPDGEPVSITSIKTGKPLRKGKASRKSS